MALVGDQKRFELVYVDRHGRPIGRNSLSARTALDARRETSRKLATALDNRATRGDRLVAGGYFQEVT